MKRLFPKQISLAEAVLVGALVLFFILTARNAHAQVVGGTLSGTITDATGAALPNVAILVHNDETGNERRLTRMDATPLPLSRSALTR